MRATGPSDTIQGKGGVPAYLTYEMKGNAGKEDEGWWNIQSRQDMIGYRFCTLGAKGFLADASPPIGTASS